MSRQPLPNRRPCETMTVVDADGAPIDVCVGFDQAGRVREIFADSRNHKVGSDSRAELSDGLVMASVTLQHGIGVRQLGRHIGREGSHPGATTASRLGLVITVAALMEGTS